MTSHVETTSRVEADLQVRQETGPRIVNAMSVDVEEHFQVSAFDGQVARASWGERESRVVASTERLLALFDEARVRSTFFVLGWVAERHPDLVRRIVAAGHELACHGYGHQLVYNLSVEEFREDVRRAKAVLEAASGVAVVGYRAPSFSVVERSLWALDVLIEEGFAYDASIFPVHHDRYGIPDAPRHAHLRQGRVGTIIEAPGSTVRCAGVNIPVCGGGYFRLLPYSVTRWAISRLNEVEGRPAMFYVHPWEVDPDQPRIDAGRLSRLRHYRNLRRTAPRLRLLMQEFAFSTVADVLGLAPAEDAEANLWPAWA
jgi:polysaccharide deacetylase family protein (PEP-CTERM system associated)